MKNTESINIAIVDDHNLFIKGLKLVFSYYTDIKVIFDAENGLHLLEQLKHLKPHVILLDIQMSVMDGITVLPEIKKYYPQIKVIILSLNGDDSMIAKLRALGADSYLTKTADPRKMYREIKDVMSTVLQESS